MSNTTFSYQLRVLVCDHCGAPLAAPLTGGQTPCGYCKAVNQLSPRDETSLLPAVQSQTPVSEPERLQRLRIQDGKPLLPPASLLSLVPDGVLQPWKVDEAFAVWRNTRLELRQTNGYEAAERLLFLTMVLANHFSTANEPMRQRAMFESALEAFTLPRQRQIMLGYLARNAVREGDLDAAQAWLARCDPRAEDLEADSSYRFARAFLDTGRGDFNSVIQVLGQQYDEVPIMDAMDPACAVLRANAWERLGRVDAAVTVLNQALSKENARGRQTMQKFIEINAKMRLCEQSFASARQSHDQAAGKAASAAASGGIGPIFFGVGVVCLVASAVCAGLVVAGYAVEGMEGFQGAGVALFTTVPIGVIFTAIGRAAIKSAKRALRLRTKGLQGTAQVVGMAPTGMRINNVPMMQFQLRVQLDGRAPYDAKARMLAHAGIMSALTPGATVPVRVDPEDLNEVMIELS